MEIEVKIYKEDIEELIEAEIETPSFLSFEFSSKTVFPIVVKVKRSG